MDAAPADLPEGFHSSQTKQPRFNEPTPLEEKNAEMVDNAAAAAAAAVPPSPVQVGLHLLTALCFIRAMLTTTVTGAAAFAASAHR